MQATPQRHTTPELRLQSMLRSARLRFTTDARPLIGLRRTADIVFRKLRIAVFVDGCFWHGCPTHCTWPAHNRAWWRAKIARNRARDDDTDRQLKTAGWTVIRVWEHAVNPKAAQRILGHVDRHRVRGPRRAARQPAATRRRAQARARSRSFAKVARAVTARVVAASQAVQPAGGAAAIGRPRQPRARGAEETMNAAYIRGAIK